MVQLDTSFIVSQILMFIAMGFDFLSFQFKARKRLFLCLIVSASLISAHYFFLGRVAAGIIVCFSVLRFITCYFTTNKKFMYLFWTLNTLALIFTYKDAYDLIIYVGIGIFIFGNFQKKDKDMRRIMMIGTSFAIVYNILVFSPMGVLAEALFLSSNIVGYYRIYMRKSVKNP